MPRPKLDLVGTWEVEQEYGIHRQRVRRFMLRGLWPDTIANIHAGSIWRRDDVERAITRLKAQGLL